jgi:hypothetical protein
MELSLQIEQILEAYQKRFKTIEPFTKDTLFTLARIVRLSVWRRICSLNSQSSFSNTAISDSKPSDCSHIFKIDSLRD